MWSSGSGLILRKENMPPPSRKNKQTFETHPSYPKERLPWPSICKLLHSFCFVFLFLLKRKIRFIRRFSTLRLNCPFHVGPMPKAPFGPFARDWWSLYPVVLVLSGFQNLSFLFFSPIEFSFHFQTKINEKMQARNEKKRRRKKKLATKQREQEQRNEMKKWKRRETRPVIPPRRIRLRVGRDSSAGGQGQYGAGRGCNVAG